MNLLIFESILRLFLHYFAQAFIILKKEHEFVFFKIINNYFFKLSYGNVKICIQNLN